MSKYLKRAERLLSRRTFTTMVRVPELSVSIYLEENFNMNSIRNFRSNFEYGEDSFGSEFFHYYNNRLFRPEGLTSLVNNKKPESSLNPLDKMDPESYVHVMQFSKEDLKQSDFNIEDVETVTSEEVSLKELEDVLATKILRTKALDSTEISTADVTKAQLTEDTIEEESESYYFSEFVELKKNVNYYRKKDMMPCLSSTN